MGQYTEDGHLIGEDGWLMPKNAHEFYERYGNRVKAFSVQASRENWEETQQRAWLQIFAKKKHNGRYLDGADLIERLNMSWASDRTLPIKDSFLLAYIRTIVKFAAKDNSTFSVCDALQQNGNCLLDERDEALHPQINQDHHESIYLRQFLTFLEGRDPQLAAWFIERENGKLYGWKGSKGGRKARVLALAEEFEGKEISGRIDWYQACKLKKTEPKRTMKSRYGVAAFNVLKMIREGEGMTIREVTDALGTHRSLLSLTATNLRRGGFIERTGEYRGGQNARKAGAVLRATALGMAVTDVEMYRALTTTRKKRIKVAAAA
jgi:hypothetical protein